MRPLRSLPGVWHAARAGRAIAGALRRRSRRGLVLLYHRIAGPRRDPQMLDVRARNFDEQLGILARTTTPLPLDEFESLRRSGSLPARAVAVTFDDGYADNLHAAAPALMRHGIPATVFITTGMIGSEREFWWDDVERIAFDAPLAGDDPASRQREYASLVSALHPLPTAVREQRLAALRASASVPEKGRESHRALTPDELRGLAARPRISIGAHTITHPSLARLSVDDQTREMAGSTAWLERELGIHVRALAYPFGTPGDVSRDTVRAAADVCDYAMATDSGAAWRWSPRWRLPRVTVRDWDAALFSRRLDEWFAE
jgi:peptidoglycan/xylan/chitin deacetylase (PgdA/CDA1 family)